MSVEAPSAIIDLEITGMHCASCSALIQECLAERPGVRRAQVDLEAASARIEYEPTEVDVEQLCAVIAQVGYVATPATKSGTGD